MSQEHILPTQIGAITIVQAQPSDLAVMTEILEEAALWIASLDIDQWRPGDFLGTSSQVRITQNIREGEPISSSTNEQVIGTITVQAGSAIDEELWGYETLQDALYVHRLAVRRAFAGKGIGYVLLKWAEQLATQLHVTVSETCTAIAYNTKELTTQATRLLASQAVKTVGLGYALYGTVNFRVTKAATTHKQTVVLSFLAQGIYVYQLNEKWQHQMKTLIAGKPRSLALRLLATLAGIRQISISGIPDNQQIPDPDHIQLLIVLVVS